MGNNREVWCGTTHGISQRTQYYPSGLPWAESEGDSVQNKKYNGKEFIEAHGLDEYYSQARMYYPAIMRTTTLDPLAEKYYSISPYAWCGNNPVNAIDPFGMDVWTTSDPNVIKQVMRDYNNGCSATIGGNRWAHFTDNQFRNGLNYDDKKGTYSFMYGTYNRYKDGSAGNFTTHLMKLPYIPGHLESWGKSDPNSLFAPDGTYNLYTRNEDKAAMAFYAGIAGGELFSAASGIIWANRARIALGTINTTIKAVNMGDKAIQTANMLLTKALTTRSGAVVGGVIEGVINSELPLDGSVNMINNIYTAPTTYIGVPIANYLFRIIFTPNNKSNETKK